MLNKVIEITALKKGGEEFSIEMKIVPLRQNSKQFFSAFIRDITQKKRAEEKIRLSEMKYKLLFESNPLPMWMLSLEDSTVIDVNEAAIKFYGYNKEEFLNLNMKNLRPEEEYPRFLEEMQQNIYAMSNRGIWKHKKKDGTLVDVEIIGQNIMYNEKKVRLSLANDVTEKLKAEKKLHESYEEIRELASHIQEVREEERAQMAREIHDELGQQLTGLKMDISWVLKKIPSENADLIHKINGIKGLLDDTIKTVRKIATELRPSILDDLGLLEALKWHSNEFEKRAGIQIQFTSTFSHITIAKNMAVGLFRIYQESLTNIARHSGATIVKTTFEQDKNNLILLIADNGKGFDVKDIQHKKTLGLLGMKERTLMMGGKYEIKSTIGKGTIVIVSVPV